MIKFATSLLRNSKPHTHPSFHQHVAAVWQITARRNLFIQVENTPNENALKFKPGVSVMGDGPVMEYTSSLGSTTSPLAKKLFRIDGVNSVLLGGDFITVVKGDSDVWQLMKPDIFATIMDHLSTSQPIYTPPAAGTDTQPVEEEDEIVEMIKELLDSRIRPSIQEDGGDVEFISFENGTVYLKLKGSCRSCSSSTVTLKNGIEQMLMHYLPEVEAVEQVKDEVEQVSDEEFEKLERKLQDDQQGPTDSPVLRS
jgi:Fe-S cluster biogenesis protein NfuA